MRGGVAIVSGLLAIAAAAPARAEMQPTAQLVIRLGDSLIFRVDKGLVVDVREAGAGEAPRKGEVAVSLMRQSRGMALVFTSNAPVDLAYNARIIVDEREEGVATSVCTLKRGVVTVESWPYPVLSLRLGPFVTADRYACE